MKMLFKTSIMTPTIKAYIRHMDKNVVNLSSSDSESSCCQNSEDEEQNDHHHNHGGNDGQAHNKEDHEAHCEN